MKTLIYFSLAFISAISLQSCLKCKGDDVNQGIIIGNLNGDCYIGARNLVINSRFEADSIFAIYDQCYIDSSFDFGSYTVLIHETSGSCNMKTIRTVERNDQLQKYIYNIEVNDCGCFYKKLMVTHNAVIVPKLPTGYTVEFVIRGEK